MKQGKTPKEYIKYSDSKTYKKMVKEITNAEVVLNAIGDGISILDRAFEILYENRVHKDMMGVQVGEKCYKAYAKKQSICGGCPVALTFKDGKLHRVQRELQTGKGRIYIEITASPLKDSTGKIIAGIEVVRDITERKEMEKQLRESEARYRTLYEGSRDGYAMVNMEGKIIESNTSFKDMIGYTEEELLQKTYEDITPPRWHPIEAKILKEQVMQRGYSDIYEKEYRRKDGTIFPIEIRTSLLKDAKGIPKAMWAFVRDITGPRQVQTVLAESEQKLREIVEHSNELHYVHDTNHVLSYASPQSLQILGYTPEEMMIEWTRLATDNPINEKGVEVTEEAIKTGEKQGHYLLELYKKDKSTVLLEIDESPLKDDKGEVIGIVGAARDVTERIKAEDAIRKSEKQIHMLLDSTAEGIYGIDLRGNCTFVNTACLHMLGYDHENELIGKNMHEVIHYKYSNGDPYPTDKCNIHKAFREGKRIFDDSEVFWRKDGTSFPVEYRAFPIEEHGKLIGAVITFLDITGRRQEEELEDMRREQKLLNKEALLHLMKTKMQVPEELWKFMTLIGSQILGVDRVSVWFINNMRTEFICDALYILTKHSFEKGSRINTKNCPQYLEALSESRILPVENALADTRIIELSENYLKPYGILSKMDASIQRHGETIGILCFEHAQNRGWTYEDQDFAMSLSQIITTSLENHDRAKAEQALRNSEQELKRRVQELEDFYAMAVGRELRMKELKEEIADLMEDTKSKRKLILPEEHHLFSPSLYLPKQYFYSFYRVPANTLSASAYPIPFALGNDYRYYYL